jgi:hypothetical protein
MPIRCQTNKGIDSSAKVCDLYVWRAEMYCKGCRERMMANGTWTEAHAKRQSELNAIDSERKRVRWASLSVEKKEALRAYQREYRSRNRDAVNAAERQRRANRKLDPVKYAAYKQKDNEQRRKHKLKLKAERATVRKRARAADEDDDDDDEKSAEVHSASPGDNVIVISDDEDEGAAAEDADDSSGSSVEGIAFVSSDDEQAQ